MLDQAIFTSVRGREMDGYQLAVASAGVSAEEAKELSIWGPAHDSLLDPRSGARSINFHRLASGRFCVSLTTALGAEYSGRGGCQIFTHSLVVPPEDLLQFANDPFRLLDAALAGGRMQPSQEIPQSLEAFSLIGGAVPVNGTLVMRLVRQVGPSALGRLAATALGDVPIAVASQAPARLLFAGLLNLMPVECRPEFSLTTGLRHSPRRPYRLVSLPPDAPELRRASPNLPFVPVDVDSRNEPGATGHPWADLIAAILEQNHLPQFAAALRHPRPGLTASQLAEAAGDYASSILAAGRHG